MKEPSLVPETSASANSAIPAYLIFAVDFYSERLSGDGPDFHPKSPGGLNRGHLNRCQEGRKDYTEVTRPETSASANSAIPADDCRGDSLKPGRRPAASRQQKHYITFFASCQQENGIIYQRERKIRKKHTSFIHSPGTPH